MKLIEEELQNYPEIGFEWKEPGIAFRVTFTNGVIPGIIMAGSP